MAYLPGFSTFAKEFTQVEEVIYLIMHYIVIGLNIFVLYMILKNIWQIIIKKKKYENIPFLFFYMFSGIAITSQVIYNIC